jgi:PAS domain S-box-containing protein
MKKESETTSRPLAKPKSKHREELNESLELLERFANGSPIGIYIVQDGKFRYVNRRFEKILGYSKKELIGTESLSYVYPDDRATVRTNAIHRLKSKRFTGPSSYEYRVICKTGEFKWILENVATFRYKNERATLGYFMDISKVKLTEYALQQEKAFSENVIGTAQAVILILDVEGHIVEFNPYLEEISGYHLNEVRGDDWFSTFLPESIRTALRALFKKALNDVMIKGHINQIITRDGRELYIEWYNKTLKDENGKVTGLLCIGHDITERRNAELLIQESENRFRSLFESMATGVIVQNADGEVTAVNPAAEKILGASR